MPLGSIDPQMPSGIDKEKKLNHSQYSFSMVPWKMLKMEILIRWDLCSLEEYVYQSLDK